MTIIHEEVKKRRTFAIISHPDAGKTTITEKILLFTGAIQIAGSIKSRKSNKFASSDWMEIEKQRGISVASSVMQIEFMDHILNLLDTPGHEDFSEDTYRVLTAVDAVLMVIDGAHGVEPQTIRLINVCRARNIPIITFVNKMDREVKEPLEIMAEIESYINMSVIPLSWPVGMGKNFHGVIDLIRNHMKIFKPGEDNLKQTCEIIYDINHQKLTNYGEDYKKAISEITLINDAMPKFMYDEFINCKQSPMFFGSAINNFGIKELLNALIKYAPSPQSMQTLQRLISPYEEKFSGVVFKIQANMNQFHRDRIAFIRISSGKFTRGMTLKLTRNKKEVKTNNVVSFLSKKRSILDEAYAGDIIGIPNHGTLRLGDVLTQGENLQFIGLPFFAPEIFQEIESKNPLRVKQFRTGLKQLGEEGAIQIFKPINENIILVGAIGNLQFEVIAHRLKLEYNAEVIFKPTKYIISRWIMSNNKKAMEKFIKLNSQNIALDVSEAIVYIASSKSQLKVAQELNPDIKFYTMKEYGSNEIY
ncbi:Peptide chain release factor 3 [Candidatus Kinetoplastibacterium sorsogonicusi]|uniref:Peptide chain release factor 3 n=1 Tax=Candidatus Kinetoplastidibacterium kentomonadis TaxID=1576550 RepID=A0A3Q8F327_9PROT|nr:peptide chain release factor 3 [Candidatus Kinetoplastibacterium sorsogonicusi]AWD32158.1 Peptide chain release factor 3 [Candidatus Kinetoplastibacterium sorsogonicusi]